MIVSRRDFLRYCGLSAAALGLDATGLLRLQEALASPTAPCVIWLHGSSCTGCSVSFLDRISTAAPTTAADALINSINLVYHATVMAAAGESAVAMARQAYDAGNYVLIVEGGVPTAFGGGACLAWSYEGETITFQQQVTEYAARAAKILCAGNCACWGCIPSAPPNPTGIKGVSAHTGRTTINIPGCPTHPDWLMWAIVQILLGASIPVDSYGRPTQFFAQTVHSLCPRRGAEETSTFGVDYRCLKEVGCRGPITYANCPNQLWNNRQNWCVDANAPCVGCTQPGFPGTIPLYQSID
jgi:hydrogenase small subunit